MSDEVEIVLNFETPRDTEAEDYIQIAKAVDDMFQPTRDVTLFRKCDGCLGKLHFRANNVAFMCRTCGVRFDLCARCQRILDITHCPQGWGCAEISSAT